MWDRCYDIALFVDANSCAAGGRCWSQSDFTLPSRGNARLETYSVGFGLGTDCPVLPPDQVVYSCPHSSLRESQSSYRRGCVTVGWSGGCRDTPTHPLPDCDSLSSADGTVPCQTELGGSPARMRLGGALAGRSRLIVALVHYRVTFARCDLRAW